MFEVQEIIKRKILADQLSVTLRFSKKYLTFQTSVSFRFDMKLHYELVNFIITLG